jgi:hypothetical protein
VPHGAVPSYHRAPVRLARDGRSVQLGRASAPTIPQPVQTMRGPKDSTGVIGPAVTAPWWQSQQLTESERTPWERMFPSVMGPAGQGSEASSSSVDNGDFLDQAGITTGGR